MLSIQHRKRLIHSVAALATLLSLAGCSSDAPNDPITGGSLTWMACPDYPSLHCSTLSVPVDHEFPDGERVDIALARLPGTGDGERRSLLINPGGPGGSGVETVIQLAEIGTVPTAIRERFDIVGFDPRGVGDSSPVSCSEFGVGDADAYPLDRQALEMSTQFAANAAAQCADKYGDWLQQLGTNAVVQDMDLIREALGEPRLDFLGYSYGTRLAARYLQRYPDKSGAIILDGSVATNSSVLELTTAAVPAMAANLERLLLACRDTDPNCDARTLESQLLQRLLGLSDSNPEGFDRATTLLILAVQEPDFGELAAETFLEFIDNGDASVIDEFITALTQLYDIDLDDADDEDTTAQLAVLCADDAMRPDIDTLTALIEPFNQQSDLFAEAYVAQAAWCAGWPEALDPVTELFSGDAPAALVIGGLSDAQTPFEWSGQMATALGARLLVSDHLGHTVTFQGASECVDDIVTAYLLDGTLPGTDACAAE